jgi:hypothetical protein
MTSQTPAVESSQNDYSVFLRVIQSVYAAGELTWTEMCGIKKIQIERKTP